jgi:hypothetical protein
MQRQREQLVKQRLAYYGHGRAAGGEDCADRQLFGQVGLFGRLSRPNSTRAGAAGWEFALVMIDLQEPRRARGPFAFWIVYFCPRQRIQK